MKAIKHIFRYLHNLFWTMPKNKHYKWLEHYSSLCLQFKVHDYRVQNRDLTLYWHQNLWGWLWCAAVAESGVPYFLFKSHVATLANPKPLQAPGENCALIQIQTQLHLHTLFYKQLQQQQRHFQPHTKSAEQLPYKNNCAENKAMIYCCWGNKKLTQLVLYEAKKIENCRSIF